MRPPALIAAVVLATAVAALPPRAEERSASPLQPSAAWDSLAYDVAGDVAIRDGEGLYRLEVPFRAQDAATVPVRFVQAHGAPDVRRLTLVVDENPAPVVAELTFGTAVQPVDIETRIRIDVYSNVRAIVEAADGETYMTGRFVRASGGCSAPALKDSAAALAVLGQMKLRWYEPDAEPSDGRREAQVMLRHPNYSGLQRDPVSLMYIPPHFVDSLELRQGDELLFSMSGGISISEDPTFRFRYSDTGAGAITVRATDTDGGEFQGTYPVGM